MSTNDVTWITVAKVVDFRARVTRCEVESDSFVEVGVIQILTILSFFGFLGLVISASVIYYLYPLVRKGKRPPALVKYMSLTRGWQEMCGLDFYQKKPKLAVLYGLRYIVMMWIILVHTIAVINYQFIREYHFDCCKSFIHDSRFLVPNRRNDDSKRCSSETSTSNNDKFLTPVFNSDIHLRLLFWLLQ